MTGQSFAVFGGKIDRWAWFSLMVQTFSNDTDRGGCDCCAKRFATLIKIGGASRLSTCTRLTPVLSHGGQRERI
ncbi:hypothetical protein NKH86_29090 [Mesorhizobium sp. M0913]|uniref:hypothetical protein n=1 Tax=Mesorhizobium sp. M0913 TaxID=2957026 RepID=UPI00333D2C9B